MTGALAFARRTTQRDKAVTQAWSKVLQPSLALETVPIPAP